MTPPFAVALRLSCLFAFLLAVAPASAHIVREEPWHPVAAAYRSGLFLADLVPVPWQQVAAAWTEPHPAAAAPEPPIARLERLTGEPARAEAIRAALRAEDRQALFEATTRAASAALRAALARTAEALDDGNPQAPLREAEGLWRAFDPFVKQADPEGWRRLGRAWLELSDSAGARGMGAARVPASPERFAAARAVIDDYFRANFEPESFTARGHMAPLPETVVAAKGEAEVAKTIAPWLPPGSFIGDQTPLPRLVLNFEEQGIDEADLPLVAYGDMLFDSPEIFGEPARSLGIACATCHNRSDINRDFIIPGVSHQKGAADVDGSFFNPIFNDRRADSLDIPTLRGIRFTAPYGRDGRFGSLREFTRNVIVNEFAGPEPTPFMLDALVAYMFEFDFLPNAKLTPDGRLTEVASEAAHRGEKIFKRPFPQLDGKACATCHIPSANFRDGRAHDIRSGGGAYSGARAGAFDTPTLLGTGSTAPYFHDGSLPTLASVVEWFDDTHALGLSEAERADLTAYLAAVGDADAPYEDFDARNTPFRLAFEELTTFASTLDTLIPARDAFHAGLLIDTVSADLALDASAMWNLAAKPQVYALAETLEKVGAAIDAGDWSGAEAHWSAFKAQQAEIDERMY